MSKDSKDLALGELAVRAGWITQDQLERCLRLQRALVKEGNPRRLGAILVSKGLLREDQIRSLLARQRTLEEGAPGKSRAGDPVEIQEGAASKEREAREPPAGGIPMPLTLRRSTVTIEGKSEDPESDFHLKKVLGQGGMGLVFSAHQASLNRQIAVKLIKPEAARNNRSRVQFVSEAIVTGSLEHPNIVPVYDLGSTSTGSLFYTMKQVKGTSWADVIKEKSEQENLEILLRVSDAVAFAHSRGIIHRDLKPRNVMLGDYGEVLVMDWGLAVPFERGAIESFVSPREASGTACYMAPEMARREARHMGPWSDVYLLGAILYEIVTGLRPHHGGDYTDCVRAAAQNIIQPADKEGELVDIALRAMATEPRDRFESVKAFQQAIREYQSHLESIVLTRSAYEHLARARKSLKYDDYAQALFGFREAVKLWSGNRAAAQGIADASLAYAFRAYTRGDCELADSLLDRTLPSHQSLVGRVEEALLKRSKMMQRFKAMAFSSAPFAWALVIFLGATSAWLWGQDTTWKYEAQAVRQQNTALRDKLEQERSQGKESKEGLWAPPEGKASAAVEKAEGSPAVLAGHSDNVWSAVFSPCGQMILTASGDGTAKIWSAETGAEQTTLKGHTGAVNRAVFSLNGKRAATAGDDGTARIWNTADGRELLTLQSHKGAVLSVAFSPEGESVATGGEDTAARIWDAETGWELFTLKGHSEAVRSVAFSPDGLQLATASADGTLKLWDANGGWEIMTLEGHAAALHCVSFSPDGRLVVTASADGTARIWDLESREEAHRLGGHAGEVSSAVFSPDGKMLATASLDGAVKIWDTETTAPVESPEEGSTPVHSVSFSPHGNSLLVAAGNKAIVKHRALLSNPASESGSQSPK